MIAHGFDDVAGLLVAEKAAVRGEDQDGGVALIGGRLGGSLRSDEKEGEKEEKSNHRFGGGIRGVRVGGKGTLRDGSVGPTSIRVYSAKIDVWLLE